MLVKNKMIFSTFSANALIYAKTAPVSPINALKISVQNVKRRKRQITP
jgi:hypothetical protein